MSLHDIKYYTEEHSDNKYAITLEEGKFAGVKFVFGEVSFKLPESGIISDEDNCTLKYDYDIIESPSQIVEENVIEFETLLGDLLLQLIDEGVVQNDIVYTGGVDEN
jgi:hypothetical protein